MDNKNICLVSIYYIHNIYTYNIIAHDLGVPGMTGPPNSFTARGPVTLTAILFTQTAV